MSMMVCSVLLAGCTSEDSGSPDNINPHHHKNLLNDKIYSVSAGKYTYKAIYLDPIGKDNYTVYGTMTETEKGTSGVRFYIKDSNGNILVDSGEKVESYSFKIHPTQTGNYYFYLNNVNTWITDKSPRLKIYEEYDDITSSKTWCDKGDEFYNLSKYKEAIKCYDKALEIDPNNTMARNNKDKALEKLKENEKLKKIITNGTLYITSNPSNALVSLITKDEALNYKKGDKLHPINKIGDITPITISSKPGEYYVLISKDGYKPYVEAITVEEGKTARISANLKKEPVGTYENPAKVGDVVRVETRYSSVYEISVISYIRGSKANNIIKNANMYNPEPKSGYEYLLVKVRSKCISGKYSDYIYNENFRIYCDGIAYKYKHPVLPEDYQGLSGTMIPGDEIEGWITFEVPKNRGVSLSFIDEVKPLCFILLSEYIDNNHDSGEYTSQHYKKLLVDNTYSVSAGEYEYIPIYLNPTGKNNYVVYGTMTETTTGTSGVRLIIQNPSDSTCIDTGEKVRAYSFNFHPTESGTYYFYLDNRNTLITDKLPSLKVYEEYDK